MCVICNNAGQLIEKQFLLYCYILLKCKIIFALGYF